MYRRPAIFNIFQNDAPSLFNLDKDKGIAAPILNKKNGNTRSTHVMPGIVGINLCNGGGTCAWYIQPGNTSPYAILPDSIIVRIAKPRRASKL
jgi:hypothetical protein